MCQSGEEALDKLKNLENSSRLTKRERKFLKKQQKGREQLGRLKKQKVKSLIISSCLFVLLAGVLAYFYFNSSPRAGGTENNQGAPRLEIAHGQYDAGRVSMSEPPIQHTYEIKNTGQGDLEIKGIQTSCMCTTAVLKTEKKTSPKFGMHDNSPFWTQTIAPGETARLEVTFDQAFHGPEGVGPAVREIYFSTNDPAHKQTVVRLLADIVK